MFPKIPKKPRDHRVLVNLRNESHHVSSEKSFIRVDPVMLLGTRERNIVETQGNLSYPTFKWSKIKVIVTETERQKVCDVFDILNTWAHIDISIPSLL